MCRRPMCVCVCVCGGVHYDAPCTDTGGVMQIYISTAELQRKLL